jgi:hypothetical protein
MIATTFQMSNSPAWRKAASPMSVHVAMLAQQAGFRDEPAQTDVMVYHQPASDVPVPASWRPSNPMPLDAVDVHCEAREVMDYDDETLGWESAGVSLSRLTHLERHTSPQRIADRRRAERFHISLMIICGAVTCTVAGWIALL